MAAVQSMTISEFMQRDKTRQSNKTKFEQLTKDDPTFDKIMKHLKKYRYAYFTIDATMLLFLSGFDAAVFASTGIDAGGRKIYSKLLGIGKWIIIVKGGFDVINQTIRGDFESAKKSFLSYILVYIVLLGLPWMLDTVDTVFVDIK